MGRSTPKSNKAILVPKDGPVLWFVKNESSLDTRDLSGIAESLELLSLARNQNGDKPESVGKSPSQRLWSTLTSADQLRAQLQALQAYRSTLLHRLNGGEISDEHEFIGTYRLLLEWALCDDITTSLRRAIHSNLDTLASICVRGAFKVREQVISSVLNEQHWTNPLRILFETLNYEPMRDIIVQNIENGSMTLSLLSREAGALQPILDEYSYYNQAYRPSPQNMMSRDVLTAMEKCVEAAITLKLFLTPVLLTWNESSMNLASQMESLQEFLWRSLTCRGMPPDDLNLIGVAHGQALLFKWRYTSEGSSSLCIDSQAVDLVEAITKDGSLPPLTKLAAVQGITATLPNQVMVSRSPPVCSNSLAPYVLDQCRSATGAAVRLSALRGLHTLITRCRSFVSLLDEQGLSHVSGLAHNTLEVVLQAWESPPARQVASAVPGLFNSLIALMRSPSLTNDDPSVTSSSNLKGLVKRILDLPPNRKGKYLALGSLLPEVGARFLIAVAGDELAASLITAIRSRGHNAVAIADLLGKFLTLLREEMNEDAGIVTTHPLNTKQRRKLEKKLAKGEYAQTFPALQELSLLPEWVALWAPHLAHALVSGSTSGRKQVAALCIPLLVTIVGGTTHRLDAANAFALLLDELQMHQNRGCSAGENIQSYAGKTETLFDQILWAKLEIAKQASLQKLMKPSIASQHLAPAIAKYLPRNVLKSSLTHSSESIRLVAFASIDCVVSTYDVSASPLQLIEAELAYWRLALPNAFKSGGKEYNTELLRTLSSLLNRLSDAESESLEDRGNDDPPLSEADGAKEVGASLPILNSFVCDFLITELIVHQGAYPGTVADKEGFVLALFHCIIVFVSQVEVAPLTDRKGTKVGRSLIRRLRSNEVSCMRQIMMSMVSTEVFSSLFSLLNSMWDHTRAAAFTSLCQLVEQAHALDIPVSSGYSSDECVNFLQNRGIYLASSPRQREADTGARMLAFINTLFTSGEKRHTHIERLAAILSERLELMEDVLGVNPASEMDSRQENGTPLPMAHGLIHALRLSLESLSISLSETDSFYGRISLICCRAVQISLGVVADLKEDATMNEDGIFEDELIDGTATPKLSRAPLNVNTGAVGANAVFSSIQQTDESESIQRFAFQRVIMGSWLMMKEACAAMASIISCRQFQPSLRLVERAGSLLIRTLTTLKHQGAAFAAHRALQKIVDFCFDTSFDNSFVNLPLLWAKRLMIEISGTDKVRDSTLRRSTGYALAFLSIMRSEPPAAITPKTLCPEIMAAIVQMSMPPEDDLETCIDRLRLRPDFEGNASFFHYRSTYTSQFAGSYKFDRAYEWRCRVHALNILRHAILDAPLASDTLPYIGDAIMSSILGYTDSAWAVRNSATMVFAAAMLRVVDANKNATLSVSSTGGNAITATELFRSYPTLLRFLLSVMVEGVDDMRIASGPACLNASSRFIHPPLYPVLLLLSRLQSAAVSGGNASDLMDPFVPIVVQCLEHRHHKVRTVAARALANLSSGESYRSSFSETLLKKCERMLSVAVHKQQNGWNMAHGALLGIQYLILRAPDPGTVLQNNDQLRVELYRCIKSGGDKYWCPPSCASIVLEILHNAAAKGDTEIKFENEVARTSLKVVSELSAKSYYAVDGSRIGEARLAAIAARGFCEHCFTKVWDPKIDYTERNISLNELSFLFENNIIDVRLEAAKAFKKDICKEIDLLLARKDLSRGTKEDILHRIAQTLQKALLSELNRAEILDSEKYVIGKHPPTVRRLSRCLLECCYALKTLNYHLEANVDVCEKLSATLAWEIALTMMRIMDESPETALDTDSQLSGNAVEHMAFAVQAMCTPGNVAVDISFSSNLRLFVQLLNRCNDVHASWKLRHSVVVAIETSQILVWDGFEDGIKATQLDLCNELLVLLQDSDPDVRFVAGRAIMQMGLSERVSVSSPSHSVSSQLALERGYEAIQDREMSSRLLAALVACCRGVDESLGCFEDEMWNSEEPDSPHELMNLGTGRKIFEEEAANSFGEMLLANQLRVATLVKSPFPLDTIDDVAQREVLELCSRVLHRLHARELSCKKNNRAPDFAHELTRSNTLFPLIHSLIIGSVVVIYLGSDDCNDVREQARSVTELLGSERESAVHPCIAQALQVLASARFNDTKTREMLLRCCFLVPGCFRS